ncbi:MAG: aconitate hydratase AcnA [Lactobacillus sp.]|jgi:aconitate hydratase|nr:aconitate hydratase AcnA [Lactobacillus sp.]MCI2031934.1 aconitate hydratase AcnA [Lactobacillus sp.]
MTQTYVNTFQSGDQEYEYADIAAFMAGHQAQVATLPYTIRILLEAALRRANHGQDHPGELAALLDWDHAHDQDVAYQPARVLLQDLTGVPAVVDLAAMRDAVVARGGDGAAINPEVPVDLVIDHSVQVDKSGTAEAFAFNVKREFERNQERYTFLKWAQNSFTNLSVVPPDTGICHQVNLERLASVVMTKDGEAFPDTLVGTDSHTTMVNGLGVLGWGVGGIEAEANMLGEATLMPTPLVVGVHLSGRLNPGVTATDLALTLTHRLREHGVVGKFVEFYGVGLSDLSLAARATVANMAPEYGATCGYFPIDSQTIDYLRLTARSEEQIALVQAYSQANHLAYQPVEDDLRHYSETLELDLGTVVPSVAGPSRPQDLVALPSMPEQFASRHDMAPLTVTMGTEQFGLHPGALGLAAITSCTNTSNPEVLFAAGLIAKKALALGLQVPAYVKTSFSPGSRVVSDYLQAAGLQACLDQLGFNLTGYGCMTCIGNSGQLNPELQARVEETPFPLAGVESANRNFSGRVNPKIVDTYLASPPLVVIYALAGTMDIDLTTQPIASSKDGQPVYLKDLWPSDAQLEQLTAAYLYPEQFATNYQALYAQNAKWDELQAPTGDTYAWAEASTYIAAPPFVQASGSQPTSLSGLRVLAKLGDSVTTDHISPAGFIGRDTPAGKYLQAHGIKPLDFNSYGSRRGHHEVMMRGTLANIRLQNQLAPGTTGGYTTLPDGTETTIFDAAETYAQTGTPLVILAGKDYGMGSSRDWAAKGVKMLGVKAIIAESFERIHRANLVMMGVIPLQYQAGDTADSLGLDGSESFAITLDDAHHRAHVVATRDGATIEFETVLRFDTPADVAYYQAGGIMPKLVATKA